MFKKQKQQTRLGDVLISKGLITQEQLASAIHEQGRRKRLLDPADANASVTPLGEILIEMGFIDRLQLKRGLNWQQRLRHASIAMALCAPFMMFMPNIARAAPITIEAENYSTMSGVINETTTDIGGGKNAGNISAGDWMTYNNVVIPSAGTYKITFRVASLSAGGSFQLKNGSGKVIGTVTVPVTGGWQTWVNVQATVTLKAGPQNLTLLAKAGAFNVNWFKIENASTTSTTTSSTSSTPSSAASSVSSTPSTTTAPTTSSAASSVSSTPSTTTAPTTSSAASSVSSTPSTTTTPTTTTSTPTTTTSSASSTAPLIVEAENYSSMSGVYNEPTTDVGGGQDTGNINTGDWMTYNGIALPVAGTYKITYRVASLSAGGTFQLKSGSGAIIDTVTVPVTGGWQNWIDVERTVTLPAGSNNLTLLATAGGFNVNWFKIQNLSTTVTSSSASSVVSSVSSSASSVASGTAGTLASGAVVIQAENYATMSGVYNEPTTDVGGGQDTGNINTGDWMNYSNTKVTLPFTGKYRVTYRVASLAGGGNLALKNASTGTSYHTVAIPKTGDWQAWVDVTTEVDFTQGDHYFTIFANTGGFNVNWFKIEPIGTPMPLTIEAENYSAMSGVYNEPTTDVGGGQDTGNINTGDWMDYKNVEVLIPATASYKVTYRVASLSAGGTFTFHEAGGSSVFDTVTVPVTGGWQNWTSVERIVTLPAGKHYFGIKALQGGFNVNWIKVEPVNQNSTSVAPPSTTTSVSSASSSSAPATSLSSSSSSKPATTTSSSWSSSSAAANAQHVSGPVGITWTPPSARENGTFLDVTELGGYEIRYKKTTDATYTYISINDAWTTNYQFPWLEGDYVFQIAAFDKNGVYSPFVDIQRL